MSHCYWHVEIALANSKIKPPQQENSFLSVKQVIDENLSASVYIESDIKTGSGSLLSRDGIIVTCFHVIENIVSGTVQTNDGQSYPIQSVLAVDLEHDVALIKIDANNLNFVNLADTEQLALGDPVITIGNPKGLQFSVSNGIVSSFRDNGSKIQFTAPISAGSSGGGLFNNKGQFIGVTKSSIADYSSQNLNFATSAKIVKQMMAELQKSEYLNTKTENQLNNTANDKDVSTPLVNQEKQFVNSMGIAINKYFEANKTSGLARIKLATFYNNSSQYKKAVALLHDFDFTEEEKVLANQTRAISQFYLGNSDKALPLFESLPLSFRHDYPLNYLYMAHLYISQEDLENARKSVKKYALYTSKHHAFYYYTLGDLSTAYALRESFELQQQQYLKKAIGFYNSAETADKKLTIATYKKGLIQLTLGDFNDARVTLQTLQTLDEKLAGDFKSQMLEYANKYDKRLQKYKKELRQEQFKNGLGLLLYGLIYAGGTLSY